MKRQIVILSVIYAVVMLLGFGWCYQFIDFNTIGFELFIKTVIFAVCSYGGYAVLMLLDRNKALAKLMDKHKMIMTYIIYVYLLFFLYEAFVGLVMVFIFKDFVYSYAFFAVITALHATKLSRNIIDKYNTY